MDWFRISISTVVKAPIHRHQVDAINYFPHWNGRFQLKTIFVCSQMHSVGTLDSTNPIKHSNNCMKDAWIQTIVIVQIIWIICFWSAFPYNSLKCILMLVFFRIQVKFIKTANRHSNEKCTVISRKCNSIWYDTLLNSILIENMQFSLHLQICTLQKPKFQLKIKFKMYIYPFQTLLMHWNWSLFVMFQ